MNRSRWSGASLLAAQSAAPFGTLLFPKVVFSRTLRLFHWRLRSGDGAGAVQEMVRGWSGDGQGMVKGVA
eukprot:5445787-Prymnesium_polylepis.1